MSDFILYAIVAGIGIAVITGVMGCFVVWKRMAYFGDSLAHSAMLGVALGISLGFGVNFGVIAVCTGFSLVLFAMERRGTLASDTLLGIFSHGALSTGMVLISLLDLRVDLHAFLFGDILTVTRDDIQFIFAGGAIILTLMLVNWEKLILMTVSVDLARAEGVRTTLLHLLFLLLMTLVVAVSVRIVGVLLITSMLIIPAAAARQLSPSPEIMAILASLIGMVAVLSGLFSSLYVDIPTGPAMVVSLMLIFIASSLVSGIARSMLSRT